MKENSTFEKLAGINVNQHTEKKKNLTYLSWAWAWDCFKREMPDATYEVYRNEAGLPFVADHALGYMVSVSVTAGGETHSMWLPVMDGANKAQKSEDYTYETRNGEKTCKAATMFDINTAIMRCLVKCLAMFGLGLYIYAGEDLPEETEEMKDSKKFSAFKKSVSDIDKKHEGLIDMVLSDFGMSKIEEVPAGERKAFYLQVKGLADEQDKTDA